jgi:chromatin assembly factor 1 subunit B
MDFPCNNTWLFSNCSGVKEVTEGTATCEDAKPLKADSMEVDVGASKAKTEANPVSVEVTPPPVSAKKSASSKPTKKRITPIAIN